MTQEAPETKTDGQAIADEGNAGAAGGGTQAEPDTGGTEGGGEAAPKAPEPSEGQADTGSTEGGEGGGEA